MRPFHKPLLSRALLLTWLVACISLSAVYAGRFAYLQLFIFHGWSSFGEKLARIVPSSFMINLLGALVGVTLFSLACLSFGLRVLQAWGKRSQPSALALAVTSFLVGEIFFSLLFLTLISLVQLPPWFVAVSLLLGFLIGFPALKSFLAQLPRLRLPQEFTRGDRIILWLVVVVFGLGLLYSSTILGYDAVVEYFSHARIMAITQRPVFFYPHDSFVVSSFHPGILFTALIQLFGDQSARMLSWVNGLAILLLGLAIGGQVGLTPRARLWFLVLVLTTTAFVDPLGDGKIELISTAPILAAVYWMLHTGRSPAKESFLLVGLLAGFAIISRPYNIFLVPLFTALFYTYYIFIQVRAGSFDFRRFIRAARWALLPLLALGVFHLFQNWIFLKSPLAPLTYARELDAGDWQWQFDPANLLTYRLLYPFTITFFNTPQSLGTISPLVVGFLPFLLVGNIRQKLNLSLELRSLLFACLTSVLIWIWLFFTVVEIRYVLFLWLLLFLPAAQLMEGAIQWPEKLIQPLIRPLVILLLAYIGARILGIVLNTYTPLDQTGQAHCHDVDLCVFIEPVNQAAAPGDRVLVLNSYRYYLRPDLFTCSSRSDEYPALEALARQNSPDFWVEVYRQGYRYVTFEKHYATKHARFGTIPDPSLAPSWLTVTLLSKATNTLEMVYRLDFVDPPIPAVMSCRQNPAGGWEVISQGE